MQAISNIPHLRTIRLGVEYREAMESEAQTVGWKVTQKWKSDPDASRYHGFAPRCKHYLNGQMVSEDLPKSCQTSKVPFPEKRVPRRGLLQVYPDDPEYARFCVEQGLEHLVNGHSSPPVNGIRSSPISQQSATPAGSLINGSSNEVPAANGGLPNGVNGSA